MEHDPVEPVSKAGAVRGFESPALIWWILIPVGMGLTAALALIPAAYAILPSALAGLLSPIVVRSIFVVAVALHLLEGAYAGVRARRRELPALRWAAQTTLLGYPSLRLLLRLTELEA